VADTSGQRGPRNLARRREEAADEPAVRFGWPRATRVRDRHWSFGIAPQRRASRPKVLTHDGGERLAVAAAHGPAVVPRVVDVADRGVARRREAWVRPYGLAPSNIIGKQGEY
jgi:hypothetical protein